MNELSIADFEPAVEAPTAEASPTKLGLTGKFSVAFGLAGLVPIAVAISAVLGYQTTSGGGNTAVGSEALLGNTTGSLS